MSDILETVIDGIKIGDTDLTQFKTSSQLNVWRKSIANTWLLLTGLDREKDWEKYCDADDRLLGFVQDRMDELVAASEARASDDVTLPARNLDLVVKMQEHPWTDWHVAQGTRSVGDLDLMAFTTAEQMVAYEFDAYQTMGDSECDRQEIETLHDMFGSVWARAFYKRKNALIAQSELSALYEERDQLNDRIAKLEQMAAG